MCKMRQKKLNDELRQKFRSRAVLISSTADALQHSDETTLRHYTVETVVPYVKGYVKDYFSPWLCPVDHCRHIAVDCRHSHFTIGE